MLLKIVTFLSVPTSVLCGGVGGKQYSCLAINFNYVEPVFQRSECADKVPFPHGG